MTSELDNTRDNLDIVDEVNDRDQKRPTFLTVLCILTFAVSAYYLFDGTATIFVSKSFDSTQWHAMMEGVDEALQDADPNTAKLLESFMGSLSKTIEKSIENANLLGFITIAIALLSAYGAYLMYKLNRKGFTVYVGAKILGIVIPLIILGFNMVTGFAYGFAAFIGMIFVILYGVNRKHMS